MCRITVTLILAFACLSPAAAQEFPTRPIRVVIPFAPGGVSDLIVRAISDPMAKALGQPLVPDNRGGAGGTLAAEQVARSAPDGHTLMLGNGGNLAVAPSLYQSLPYDPQRDLAPIAMVARTQLVLVAHPVLPVATVGDLVKLAKSKPGKLTYASSGIGAGPHLAAELLKSMAAIDLLHVPYKGSSPMLTGLMGGEVDVAFDSIATSLPHVRSGRLRALAVSGEARSPLAPELPTVMESGVAKFGYTSYFALVAPAATPAPIVQRLSRDVVKVTDSREVRARLQELGLEPITLGSTELDATLRKERAMWATIIGAAGIKLDDKK